MGQTLVWRNRQLPHGPCKQTREGESCSEGVHQLLPVPGPYQDRLVGDAVAAVPGDVQNSRQTVDHSFITQDVGGVQLSLVHKQLSDKTKTAVRRPVQNEPKS